ncbi:tyrosyl-tRNA synthetase [Bacilli bacterium PM5-3]|nr:tyrosyl-tRNA synthetase [Bacilli bacterium PM5-3]MDH6603826.1 tyrosyl-tRNA synthetase [Bacilli bacterium PM5-9]
MNIIKELEWRGLIHSITDQEKLEEMAKGQIKVYLGVDPTADSMHIGHLLPVIMLRRFQMYGHIPVPVMGGGTGQIGDPSGRSSERQLLDLETIESNVANIRKQVESILDLECENKPMFLNNNEWGSKISMFEFLRDYGKYFNINYMLAKDTIASRLETGISYTEFSYTIIQALDWLKMYEMYGVTMQIGGSDQWGNITSGLELLRKKHPESVCAGLTMPLITKADGTKFGKTAGGAIWLDPKKTSPYEFYQFFLNSADDDVINYLKVFTFFSQEEIAFMEKELKEKPHERFAQKELARAVTTMVHSKEDYEHALEISKALFSGDIKNLNLADIKDSFKGVSESVINVAEMNIIDFLVETEICKSKREAREFVGNNSITINGDRINDVDFIVKKADAFDEEITIVRRGKKNYFKVIFS